MNKKPSLSIVIPCYNEEQRIEKAISGALAAVECSGRVTEIIVVDDGSEDDTFRLGSELCASDDRLLIVQRSHQGKGGAIKAGVELSRGDIIFTADADWSMPPEQIVRFIEELDKREDVQIVISSREVDGAVRHDEPMSRHIIGRAFNMFVRAVALTGVHDSQCGFKAYRAQAAHQVFSNLKTKGWAFDVEVLARARRLGLPLSEIPIDWRYDADSRLNTIKDSLTMTYAVIKIRIDMMGN